MLYDDYTGQASPMFQPFWGSGMTPKHPKIEGFFFTLAVRLFNNDWSPSKRAVAIGLCRLAAENNGTGAFKLHTSDLIDAIKAFTFGSKTPGKRAVLAEIESLSGGVFLQKLPNNWVFIREFWGINHSVSNPNHWRSVTRTLESMPVEARLAWHDYYDPIKDGIANAKRDAMPYQQEHDQEHEQEHKIEPPLRAGSSPAAAAPVESLASLEAKLPEQALETWREFVRAMHQKRVTGKVAESKIRAVLAEFLSEIEAHYFTPAQVVNGLRGCMNASKPPAENGRYFRKAATSGAREPIRTTQPQSTNMLDRAYDPTRSTVPGFKEVKL